VRPNSESIGRARPTFVIVTTVFDDKRDAGIVGELKCGLDVRNMSDIDIVAWYTTLVAVGWCCVVGWVRW